MTIKIVMGVMGGFGTIAFAMLSIQIIAIQRNTHICLLMDMIGQKDGQKRALK